MTGAAIEEIGRRFNLKPDSVAIDHSDIVSDLMYGSKVLLSLTDQDALWEGVSRDSHKCNRSWTRNRGES